MWLWKLRKRQILPVNQNLSTGYFSLAKFQLSSYNLSLRMIWRMTYTQKLPKQCSATLIEHTCCFQYIYYFVRYLQHNNITSIQDEAFSVLRTIENL